MNTPTCERCGESLRAEDGELVHGARLCLTCECEKFLDFCGRCGESIDREQWEPTHFILLDACDGLSGLVTPGYYRIDRRPFYASALLSGFFYNDAITRVARLTGAEVVPESDTPAHMLCEACTRAYPILAWCD